MIEKKGLFYEFEYYLLPDDVSSVAELEEKYGHRAFETVRYEQKTCMAPYVTGESERIETISVSDYSLAFDATLFVLPQKEYDAKLRENIAKTCPSCHYYTDDGDEDISTHYDEISYDNVCYRHSIDGEFPYFARAAFFWEKFAAARGKLEKLLDKGKVKAAKKLFETIKAGAVISDSFLFKKGDVYTVCFVGAREDVYSVMVDAVLQCRTDDIPDTWEFYPYLKKGVFTYNKKETGFDMKKTPPLFSVKEEDGWFRLHFAAPERYSKKRAWMYKEAAYLYLCEQMGEDLMLFFTNERGDAEKGEPLISAEAVCRMFESRVTDEIKEQYPESLYRPIARMDGQNAPGKDLPFRGDTQYFTTAAPSISIPSLSGEQSLLHEEYGFTFGYLYVGGLNFDNDTENAEKVMATLAHYMSGGKKKNSVSAASTGATYYTSGFSLEFLMLDGHSLYEKFRLLAPVLKKFGARLVVLKGGRPLVYDCENGPRIASETLS